MSIPNNSRLQCWIGLAHVKPTQGNNLLSGDSGAFVPVLALAAGIDDFLSTTAFYLNSYDFEIIEIEDIELYNDRLQNSSVSDDIKKLRANISDSNPILLDVFQSYT